MYLLECAESQSQQGKCYFEPKMPTGRLTGLGQTEWGVLWAVFFAFLKKGNSQKLKKKKKEKEKEVRCEEETSWICIHSL